MLGLMDDHGPAIIAEGSLPPTTYLPAPKVHRNFYPVAAALVLAAVICVGIGWSIDEIWGAVAGAGAAIAICIPIGYLVALDSKAIAYEEANDAMSRHSATGGAFVTRKLQLLDETHRAQLSALQEERDALASIVSSTGIARDPKTGRLVSVRKVAGPLVGSAPETLLIEGSTEA